MRLLITNGQVSTPDGLQHLDILCEGGRISALLERGARVDADETVNATGRLVFPGFIDPHVHSRDPGQTEKEDFAHSTKGALVAGVTTVLEMPNAIPPVDSVAVLHERRAQHEKSAWVDFGLWGISIGDENLDQLRPLVEAGVVAIKIFWGYALRRDTKQLVYNLDDEPPENLLLPPDNGQVLSIFAEMSQAGGLLAAHCEDRGILTASERALGHPIETYQDLLDARPDIAESTSIAIAAEFAKATGCRFHVVHMASQKGADTVRAAQARVGVRSSSLARAGFTGSTASLVSSFGQIAGRLVDVAALDAPLNYQRLGITLNYFKRHSACALSHAAIDAIQSGTNPPAHQIDDVLVETVSNNLKLDRQPQDNALSGRFSLQYAVATALVVGRTDVEAFSYRPDVAEFARRVQVRLADDLEARWPEAAAARVTISAAGQTFTRQVDNPHGHHSQPLTPEELQDKFRALVDAPHAAIWWNRLTHLSEVSDCSDLLTGAAA